MELEIIEKAIALAVAERRAKNQSWSDTIFKDVKTDSNQYDVARFGEILCKLILEQQGLLINRDHASNNDMIDSSSGHIYEVKTSFFNPRTSKNMFNQIQLRNKDNSLKGWNTLLLVAISDYDKLDVLSIESDDLFERPWDIEPSNALPTLPNNLIKWNNEWCITAKLSDLMATGKFKHIFKWQGH